MRTLTLIEVGFVAAFAVLAATVLLERPDPLPAIDVAALAVGDAEEQWVGIFMQEQHIGYAVSREIPAAQGQRIYQQQSTFRIASLGMAQQVVTAGTALTDSNGRLIRFDFLFSSPATLIGHGEMKDNALHLEIVQGGSTHEVTLPMAEPPVISSTLGAAVNAQKIKPGDKFTLPYFDPVTLSQQTMDVQVEAPEVLPNGDAAFWLRLRAGGVETRRLVDETGNTLREESMIGLSTVRMPKEEAMAVDGGEPPDLVALTRAPLEGALNVRLPVFLNLQVGGVEASRLMSDPPLQVIADDTVTVSVPLLAELPDLPVRGDHDIGPTPSLPATHEEVVARAQQVVGDAATRLDAARRIYDFVFQNVQKLPTIGVPNGLEVLRSLQGDCNEHTALYVTLARAAGIPSRIAAGLVYSPRMGDGFYYHAWPEVYLGGPTGWVPIDPTLGQFPADATHVKVVNGDLERQVEIMGIMGRIKLKVKEVR